MISKDSIDKLLYKYAENSLEDLYDHQINQYLINIEQENLTMKTSFNEFWKNKDNFKKKNIIKQKKIKKIISIIAASLIFAIILIGPSKIATYANEIFTTIKTKLSDRTIIEYDIDENLHVLNIKPTYIPNGYSIIDEYEDIYSFALTYSNGNPENDIFYENFPPSNGTTLSLDTENSKTYSRNINGLKIDCIENDKMNTVYYETDNQIYTIAGKINIEELFKMLESVISKKGD